MNTLAAILLCISPVADYTVTVDGVVERGTIVYRLPASCSVALGAPKLPEGLPVAAAPPPETSTEAAEPPRVKKKVARPAAKKRSARGCKPGRTRDSRGRCGRW